MAVSDSILDALAFQFRLAGHVEPLRLEQAHPHREQDRPWHGSPWLFYDDTNSNAGSRGPSDEHRDTFKFVVLATGLRRRDVAWPSSKNLFVDCTRAAPRKRIRTSTWPS